MASRIDQAVRDPDVVAWANEVGHNWVPQARGNGDAVMQAQAAFFERWKSVILS